MQSLLPRGCVEKHSRLKGKREAQMPIARIGFFLHVCEIQRACRKGTESVIVPRTWLVLARDEPSAWHD